MKLFYRILGAAFEAASFLIVWAILLAAATWDWLHGKPWRLGK